MIQVSSDGFSPLGPISPGEASGPGTAGNMPGSAPVPAARTDEPAGLPVPPAEPAATRSQMVEMSLQGQLARGRLDLEVLNKINPQPEPPGGPLIEAGFRALDAVVKINPQPEPPGSSEAPGTPGETPRPHGD